MMANENHAVNGMIENYLKNLHSLVDANTVVGEPLTLPDGIVIIPVSKVSIGFATGGSDIPTSKPVLPFGGGGGGGVTASPIGFLVVKGGDVQLLQVNDTRSTADRVVGLVPEIFDKLSSLVKKAKDEEPEKSPEPEEK